MCEAEDMAEVIAEPMEIETSAVVLTVRPRSNASKRGPSGVFRLPWFSRFQKPFSESRPGPPPTFSTAMESKSETPQQWAQGLALPLWQTMLAGGIACVCHRAVAGSIEDLMGGHRRPAAVVAQNFMKFSKGGFPFGALCCSFYAVASRLFTVTREDQ